MDNDTSLTDFYDYSVHRHCVTFGFDEKGAHAGIFFTSKSSGDSPDNGPRRRCCILYNVATKEILERDYDTANEMILKNKDPNVFYVDNIFMRLYGIYQKKEKDNHDEIILHAVGVFMRKLVDEYQSNLSCERESYMPFHFGFLVPTHWDHAIRTEIIRPLFVQTKLINKDDDDRRLLFLTRLESAMTDIQHSEKKMVERKNIEMVHGKKYILYDLKFDEEDLNVGLDLFSTHQPPPSSVYPYFETKILQTLIVKIPLNSDMEHGIEECLKKRNFGFKTTRSIEILNALVNHYKHHKFIFSEKDKDEYVYQEKQLYKYQPFKALFDKDNKPEATLLIKKCDLTQEEIESIQSITTKEIHKDLFTSAEKAIVSSVERLKRYEDSRLRTGIFSVLDMPLFSSYNLRFNDEFHVYASWLLFTWLKDFFKEHGVSELKSQFVENRDSNLRYQIKLEDMMKGFQTQIQWKVRVSHMNTPPAIKERPAIKNWEEAAQLSLFPKSTILRYAIEIGKAWKTNFIVSDLANTDAYHINSNFTPSHTIFMLNAG
ncbi:uncharacterized protein EV154DRAFT_481213 [Mucor mucedo]|uniref:uncharacterized protein n=1 Tax=Mucor mucedo TaxID=29922 RepID=UPI002220D979|nr:uncharacterized protein EV154DRAFT_481213 [Mucor mucedo]KAI7891570.1 hypothetical protein EV154DRAFT_481213 [Mucor mucedo]